MLVGASHCSASEVTRANAGMAALQNFYKPSTGFFSTPAGWWEDANALETTIDYSARSGVTLYTRDVPITFNKNRAHNFLNDYYDDEGWWTLTWIKAYDLTGNTEYLNAAKTIFADMAKAWDDSTCGGGIWWNRKRTYKNAIANELFLTAAARLHNRTPGDGGNGSFLDWAQREWKWFAETGMINSSHLINDGLTASCQNNGRTTWSYNQGVILGGLADLYRATGDTSLLTEAEALAAASSTSPALVDSKGILVDSCEATHCGNDATEFKGVYAKNLWYLYATDRKAAWRSFLVTNADSIWTNDRNSANQFGLHWAGPFDTADGSRQSIGEDVMNSVIPATTYVPVNSPDSASFGVTAQTSGTYLLTFRFSETPSAATRTVLVNGIAVDSRFSFSGTTAQLKVSLTAGQNTITVSQSADNHDRNALTLTALDSAPDGVSFARFQAEAAATDAGAQSSHAGFTFHVQVEHPGSVKLLFHYAAAEANASRKILVNGVPVQKNLAFPNTNSGTNRSFVSMNADLHEGNNVVTVVYDSSSGSAKEMNLDSLQILY